jgi:hypothetical protein
VKHALDRYFLQAVARDMFPATALAKPSPRAAIGVDKKATLSVSLSLSASSRPTCSHAGYLSLEIAHKLPLPTSAVEVEAPQMQNAIVAVKSATSPGHAPIVLNRTAAAPVAGTAVEAAEAAPGKPNISSPLRAATQFILPDGHPAIHAGASATCPATA